MPNPIISEGFSLRSEINRSRVAADLREREVQIGLALILCLALGTVAMTVWHQLCTMEAAARAAAGV